MVKDQIWFEPRQDQTDMDYNFYQPRQEKMVAERNFYLTADACPVLNFVVKFSQLCYMLDWEQSW